MTSGDRGSVTPLILLFFLLAALVVMGTAAAGSAFLAQRDLQSVCDSAALATADALDPAILYRGDADVGASLPLSEESVDEALRRFTQDGLAGGRPRLSLAATTDGRSATVVCQRTAHVPFGAVFGHARGVLTTARSSARLTTRP